MPAKIQTLFKRSEFPFVILEGIPGSGKTTFRNALIRDLAKLQLPAHHVGQHGWLSPNGAAYIVQARKGAIGINIKTLIDALIEDKRSHVANNIYPHLSNRIIIADRFYVSDLILLACHGNSDKSQYVLLAEQYVQMPNVCFILNASIKIAKVRLMQSRASKRFLDSDKCIDEAAAILESRFPTELCLNTIRLQNNTQSQFEKSLRIAVNIITKSIQM